MIKYNTVGDSSFGLRSEHETARPFDVKKAISFGKALSTAALAMTVLGSIIKDDKTLPTTYQESKKIEPLKSYTNEFRDEFYAANSAEVNKFISKSKGLSKLLDAIPALVFNIFGKAYAECELYKDYEEGWENLLVRISLVSGKNRGDVELENKFFSDLTRDKENISALEFLTISFG